MTEESITTLVVDDEVDIRTLVKVVIEIADTGLEVIGEAADGEEALERYCDLDPPPDPTVVLLDNRMPGLSGLEVARRILERRPNQLVVLFSAHLDEAVEAEAEAMGITACVSKEQIRELPGIIRQLVDATAA